MSTAQASTQQSQNTLLCLTENNLLLLPDVAVAEIIDYQAVDSDDDMPTWFLGLLPWRNLDVPLVSFEAMKDNTFFSQSAQLKIIIMHSTSHRDDFPFWGFVCAEAPKMRRMTKDQLAATDVGEDSSLILSQATFGEDVVVLPNLAEVESQIAGLLY